MFVFFQNKVTSRSQWHGKYRQQEKVETDLEYQVDLYVLFLGVRPQWLVYYIDLYRFYRLLTYTTLTAYILRKKSYQCLSTRSIIKQSHICDN